RAGIGGGRRERPNPKAGWFDRRWPTPAAPCWRRTSGARLRGGRAGWRSVVAFRAPRFGSAGLLLQLPASDRRVTRRRSAGGARRLAIEAVPAAVSDPIAGHC